MLNLFQMATSGAAHNSRQREALQLRVYKTIGSLNQWDRLQLATSSAQASSKTPADEGQKHL